MMTSTLANFVRKHDPDRFLACLFAPTTSRETLLLLCAFNHELARAREVASQPILALIRLQWWREVVMGARRQHEVAGPLGAALDAGLLRQADLLGMVEAREIETEPGMPDLATWKAYCAGTGGGWAVAAGRVLGADEPTLVRLRSLGAAYSVAAQIGSVAALAQQQRCMLPEDLLGAHGLTAGHVLQDPGSAEALRSELSAVGLRMASEGGGWFPRTIIAAGLPAVLARRDLQRGTRLRGIGDKLAVTAAAFSSRI